MSDLISRKLLLESVKEIQNQRNGCEPQSGSIINLIKNAPAVRGDVVGYISSRTLQNLKNNPEEIDGYGISRERLIEDDVAIYTTPQQPQSVADALEEVISIVWDVLDNPELSGHGYCNDLEGRIRALIKRNAVKEGE